MDGRTDGLTDGLDGRCGRKRSSDEQTEGECDVRPEDEQRASAGNRAAMAGSGQRTAGAASSSARPECLPRPGGMREAIK